MTDKTKSDGAAEPVSKCCGAPMRVESGQADFDEKSATNWYVCTECEEPCDAADFTPAEQPVSKPMKRRNYKNMRFRRIPEIPCDVYLHWSEKNGDTGDEFFCECDRVEDAKRLVTILNKTWWSK